MPIRPYYAMATALLLGATVQPALARPASGDHAVAAQPLQVELAPDPGNPANPKMGDQMLYRTTIRNAGTHPIRGGVAWLGLVQVDPGQEQPVDLEDWSAHKAVTIPVLAPDQAVATEWPMRLIAAGHYRVVVSAAAGDGALSPSPFVNLSVMEKPVVESGRVLPVALGMPALLLGGLLLRRHGWRNAA